MYYEKVKSIKYCGKELTADLKVFKNNNFLLKDGIVSHNCLGEPGIGKCLSKNELILTPNDSKPISELELGNKILSYNFIQRKIDIDKVLAKDSTSEELYEIEYENGKSVRASANHKFFVLDSTGKTVERKVLKLKKDDKIIAVNKTELRCEIVKSIKFAGKEKCIDIETLNQNFILSNGVISHNSALAIEIADKMSQYMGVPFTLDNILFDTSAFFKLVKTLPPKSWLVIDEAAIDWDSVDAQQIIPFVNEYNIPKKESIEEIYNKYHDIPSLIKIHATDFRKDFLVSPSAITKHRLGKDKMLKITTKSGKTVTGTTSHSFIINNDGDIKTIRGSELKIGMRIPVRINND